MSDAEQIAARLRAPYDENERLRSRIAELTGALERANGLLDKCRSRMEGERFISRRALVDELRAALARPSTGGGATPETFVCRYCLGLELASPNPLPTPREAAEEILKPFLHHLPFGRPTVFELHEVAAAIQKRDDTVRGGGK